MHHPDADRAAETKSRVPTVPQGLVEWEKRLLESCWLPGLDSNQRPFD